MISEEEVLKSLKIFQFDEDGMYIEREFDKLSFFVYLNSLLNEKDKKLIAISQNMQAILTDLENLSKTIRFIDWLRVERLKGEIKDRFLWWNSNSIIIEYFHIKMRSVLDFTPKIIREIAKYPSGVSSKSFNNLYEWLNKDIDERANNLGE